MHPLKPRPKVAVIVPILDIDSHLEFAPEHPLQNTQITKEQREVVVACQRAVSFRVFVTSDVRRALIRGEQLADLIVYDSHLCEVP
jgi:hypothetical protein